MIVLVGHERDEHCDHLEKALQGRGREVVRLSLERLPEQEFAWEPLGRLRIGDRILEPSRCSGIWRRPGSAAVTSFREEYGAFVERECRDAFHGALAAIGVRWVTEPLNLAAAELKLVQLQAAARLGIAIPATVVTNSPGEAGAFSERHTAMVAKPIRYGLVSSAPRPLIAWTTSVSSVELQDLSGPPVIVQERVAAARHLRVVTVGCRGYVARLEAGDDVDWRAQLQNHCRFKRAMPEEFPQVAWDAVRVASELKLGFSAQDWIVTTEEKVVFLEANPNGQWLFLDGVHEGEITDALVDELERLEE